MADDKYSPMGTNELKSKSFSQNPGAARMVLDDPVRTTKDDLVQPQPNGTVPQNGGLVIDY
jgi:hypothetical protein